MLLNQMLKKNISELRRQIQQRGLATVGDLMPSSNPCMSNKP